MKILIVDEMHDSIVQMPTELGLEVDYFPNISLDEVLSKVKNYEGLIIRSKFSIDEAFLNHAPNLKFIGRAGAGLDLIDIAAVEKRNIKVFSANEANKIAVSEHLIGMLLCLLNNIQRASIEIKGNQWNREKNRGEELFGKKVGLIGFGNNGQATAERLLAFGCEIWAYDKFKYGFGNHLIKECSLDEIVENAEIVSLHLPLTKDTKGFIDEKFINSVKSNFYFCNISRGEIVNQTDLVAALKSGKIKGACLDVLENEKINNLNNEEKISFDYLKNAENVILSPHIAGWSFQSYKRINKVLKDKIKRFLEA